MRLNQKERMQMKYSGLINKIFPNWGANTSSQTSKTTSGVLFNYGNIPLKTYIEIAGNGLLEMLIVSGKPTDEELVEAWELIIQKNGENSGENRYDAYMQLVKAHSEIIAKQTTVAILLEILWWQNPPLMRYVTEVRNEGYRIDTANSEAYKKSIEAAKRKCSGLKTRAEMARKEIQRQFKPTEGGQKDYSFEEIVASLRLDLGKAQILVIIDGEKLTLSEYNTYRKAIREYVRAVTKQRTDQRG